MTELDHRFREADRIRTRDLWTDIVVREPSPQDTPSPTRRTIIVVLALLVAVAGLALVARSFGDHALRPTRPALPTAWSRVPPNAAVFGPHFEMNAVAPGGPGLVAVGYADVDRRIGHRILTGAAAIWISSDGSRWRRIPQAEIGYGLVNDVAAGTARLVAVGYDFQDTTTPGPPTHLNAVVWTSEDGTVWTRLPADGAVYDRAIMNSVTRYGAGFAAVGYSVSYLRSGEEVDRPAAWVSPDGTTWSRATVVSTSSGTMSDVATFLGRLVGVGSDDAGAAAWSSEDGHTWTRIAGLPSAALERMRSVTAGPNGLVAVGMAAHGPNGRAPSAQVPHDSQAVVWSSFDGVRWRRLPPDPAVFFDTAQVPKGHHRLVWMDTVAAGPSGYVAIGHDTVCGAGPACGPGPVVVWSSVDGESWARRAGGAAFVGGEVVDVRGLTAWTSQFVAVGFDAEGSVFPGPEQAAVWISDRN